MRAHFALTAGLAVGLMVGMYARAPRPATPNVNELMDAAFQDGAFLANFDVEKGRKPHLASGRWNSDADRANYIAGYEQAYLGSLKGRSPARSQAETAGYLDGLTDGAADRASSQPFRPERAMNRHPASNDAKDTKLNEEYRNAYLNGYQQSYFTNQNASPWRYYVP